MNPEQEATMADSISKPRWLTEVLFMPDNLRRAVTLRICREGSEQSILQWTVSPKSATRWRANQRLHEIVVPPGAKLRVTATPSPGRTALLCLMGRNRAGHRFVQDVTWRRGKPKVSAPLGVAGKLVSIAPIV